MIKKTWILTPILVSSIVFPAFAANAPNLAKNSPKNTYQVIERLIECESNGKNVAKLDSNGKYSYGILQIQFETWNRWSKESGITGEPMNKTDAVKMATWAIKNGKIKAWTEWEYAMGLQDKCKWQR